MGDRNGLCIALRHILARQRKAGRIEMIETEINPFLLADRQGEFTKQEITAIRVGFIERAAKLKAIEHLGADTLMP